MDDSGGWVQQMVLEVGSANGSRGSVDESRGWFN